MSHKIRLILLLHNHQPVGNFDNVFEQAYQDSYLPFLNVFENYPTLPIALHVSGPLMEWLDEHHSDYVDRLAHMVASGRIEIIGGAFYEPILTMIPSRDRIGQIKRYSQWLENRLGAHVRGMWIPERVWEQTLVQDSHRAGIQYTMLDDFHFKNAGLSADRLHGYYVTEDEGHLLAVFPGSEQMRYLMPFAEPEASIDYLHEVAKNHPDGIVVFGDDGEKFGSWPETKKHTYDDGWLVRFFDLLVANQDWIQVTTPAEAYRNLTPLGKVYLPDGSYREMTEWALPTEQQLAYESIRADMQDDPRWSQLAPFIRGGFWRNFKIKYSEANEMYSRMMMVSERLEDAHVQGADAEILDSAKQELYRGQCNCAYWHGAFGGIYLPHLRNSVYHHLIKAENWIDRAMGKTGTWIEASAFDYNLDSRQEVRLTNDRLIALISPAEGGQLYELDVRSIAHNLLASLRRRPESYHQKVSSGSSQGGHGTSSIHDRVVFKQEGLDERLQYDAWPRKSLLDHFFDADVSLEQVAAGAITDPGDFISGIYEARLRRSTDRIQLLLSRTGRAFDYPLKITKGITMESGSGTVEIAYLLEGVPQEHPLHFAVEFNFSGLPAGVDNRYYYRGDGERLGQLGDRLDLQDTQSIGLVDEWLGIDLKLSMDRPTQFWAFPVETVSQSEGGFELVHQSVAVLPHWSVQGDHDKRWSVRMSLNVDTSRAESQFEQLAESVML